MKVYLAAMQSMVTSSLKGVFRTDEKARQELLNLIRMGSK